MSLNFSPDEHNPELNSISSDGSTKDVSDRVCTMSKEYPCVVEGSAAHVVIDDVFEWLTPTCIYFSECIGLDQQDNDSGIIADDAPHERKNSLSPPATPTTTSRENSSPSTDQEDVPESPEVVDKDDFKRTIEERLYFLNTRPASEQVQFLKGLSQKVNCDMDNSEYSVASFAERDVLKQVINEKLLVLASGFLAL
mmetsp:Transcript_4005/g.7675  ORF Transcript_4005/g.7675 Transcript_4005/m.7675 type:complete len:196 (-) Transcript_4005:80-667(-)